MIKIDLNNNYTLVKEQLQQQITEDFCDFPEYNFLINYKGEKIALTYKIYNEECNWNMIKPNSIEFIFNNNTFAIDYEFPKENNSSQFIYNRIKENLKIRKSSSFYLNFNLKSKVDVKLFNSIIENSINGSS